MTDYPAPPVEANHVEPVPRRIRAYLGGQALLDTTQARYVWEWPAFPQYYIPLADVRAGVLVDEGTTEETPRGDVRVHGVRIGDLCANLGRILDRSVIDKTGLASVYDITLTWQDSPAPAENGLQENSSPSLFTALQEQLGLKLTSAKGPVDVLVVDKATPPNEN